MVISRSYRKYRPRTVCYILIISINLGSTSLSDQIVSSGPVNSADLNQQQDSSQSFAIEPNNTNSSGKLKPPLVSESEWVPAIDREQRTEEQHQEIETVSAEFESATPVTEGLDAPITPPPPVENSSDGTELNSKATGQEKVIQSNVDIRPPVVQGEIEEDEDSVDACWTDPFVDDHLYLWSENREELELLFNNGNGFGMTTLGADSKITGGDGPLWANFKFGWHFLDGPTQPDIRSQTYDLSFEFNFAQQLDSDWGLHLQLAPTWSTDWDNKTGDAFRLIGGGLLSYDFHDGTKFLIGGVYLDRPDLPFVPTIGMRFSKDDVELDLIVPRPRIAWRYDQESDESSWFYLAGELGGGSWAVERELSRKEIMGYRDYRLLVGWETKKVDGSREVFEMGWVFDRRLEFDRFTGSDDLDDTFVMRWGHIY